MKSKELKNYNLADGRMYNEVIEAKPILLLLIMMAVGFILLICKKYVAGATFFFFGAACLLFLPSRRLIEFYDDNMIMYNKARKDECNIIYYDDIKFWDYKIGVSIDELIITLVDGSVQKCEAFSKVEFENNMNKYVKDKKVINEPKPNIFAKNKGNKNAN